MDTDRNLLFGVLALQADLIDAPQFIEACLLWTTHKQTRLADLLVGRGWIEPADKAHVEYLLERKLRKHGGNIHASLAAIPDDIKRSLAALGDDDIQRSLVGGPFPAASQSVATIDHVAGPADRYCRLRLHATGGIGRVWLAHDGDLGRDVALKELRPERAEQATFRARFLQEAQITGQLEHPGIIPVYELARARDGGQPFYTMRFVKGRTLSEASRAYHVRRLAGQAEALELPALLNAFVTVCNTVAYAHARGVIHRDLKGQNVIVGDFGEVVVLDWGLAKLVGQPEAEAQAPSVVVDAAGADSGYTVHGQALGTPAYMAPEQAGGRLDLIDRRTDVYGLGAILFEILTGAPPFQGESTEEVLRKVREEAPAPPHQFWPEVPPALEALCLRALAKRVQDRPAAAVELALEVQGWQESVRRKAEEALRESEALYHSLVENLPCLVLRKDLDGRFTFANHRYCEFVGLSLDQLLGKTDADHFPRELADKYRRDDRTVLETGGILEILEEVALTRGENRHCQVLKTAVRDASGKVTGIQLIAWDVTGRKLAEQERRKAEEALRESEALYYSLVESLPCSVFRKDLEGRFTFANQRFCEHVGLRLDQLLGKTNFDLGHPQALAEKYRRDDEKVLETGEVFEDIEEVVSAQHKGKRYGHILKIVARDAAGKITGTQGIAWDVTARKFAEEALARERDLLHTLMDNLPDGIYFKDAAGRFLRVNKAVADYFGVGDPADVVGKTDFDFFTEKYAGATEAAEQAIIQTGRPLVGVEEKVTFLNGRVEWVSTTKLPFRDKDGKIIGTFGVSRNISAPRRAEEELARLQQRLEQGVIR